MESFVEIRNESLDILKRIKIVFLLFDALRFFLKIMRRISVTVSLYYNGSQ